MAYNIGTSLNKEDIDNHRQGIVPTAQTLQGLSTDEQLAYHTQNQALLDENKEQLEGEMESGDGFESNRVVIPPFINTNNPNARRWNVNNNPHALTVRREIEAIRRVYPNFQGFSTARPTNSPITQAEAAEYTAFRLFIRNGTNQTYADHNVAYREFLKSPYYQNLNRPNSTQLNIGLNNANYNVARHEQINNRMYSDGTYYYAGNMRISIRYYEKVWGGGRPAPFVQAREILNSNPTIERDPQGRPGFNRYVANNLELVYNPTTGEIWHIQPIRKR